MSNWIKFTDRMPEEGQPIRYKGKDVGVSDMLYFKNGDEIWMESWQPIYTQDEMDRAIEQAITDERESQSQSELDDFLDWPDEF